MSESEQTNEAYRVCALTLSAAGAVWVYAEGNHQGHCFPVTCEGDKWKQPDEPHREVPVNPSRAVTITVELSTASPAVTL